MQDLLANFIMFIIVSALFLVISIFNIQHFSEKFVKQPEEPISISAITRCYPGDNHNMRTPMIAEIAKQITCSDYEIVSVENITCPIGSQLLVKYICMGGYKNER